MMNTDQAIETWLEQVQGVTVMTITDAIAWLEARGFELIAVLAGQYRFVHTDGPGFILTSTTIDNLPK